MRAKLFFVMAGVLLWPVSVFSETSDFDVRSFIGGNELFRTCSDHEHGSAQGYCIGYVAGMMDAISAVDAMKAVGRTMPSTCPPKEHLAPDQLKDIVVQYLTAHPETRHQAAAGEVWRAIQAAFPCK